MTFRKIGITGNIGSGKTTICRIFESMGIHVAYADEIAKEVMRSRLHLRSWLMEHLGPEAFSPEGALEKSYIARSIFQNSDQRKSLQKVVHPVVQEYLGYWFDSHAHPYALEEAALIFESGSHTLLDRIIWVDAPQDIRMKRVMLRDKVNEEEFLARDSAQGNPELKKKMSHYCIVNDGNHSLIQQIADIHRHIILS